LCRTGIFVNEKIEHSLLHAMSMLCYEYVLLECTLKILRAIFKLCQSIIIEIVPIYLYFVIFVGDLGNVG
jgi:hypothetical protein